jgi:hypothetical protein
MTPVLHVMIVSMTSVDANLPSQRQTLGRTLECQAAFSRQLHTARNFKLDTLNVAFLYPLNALSCVTKTSKNTVAFEKIPSKIIRVLPGTYERI